MGGALALWALAWAVPASAEEETGHLREGPADSPDLLTTYAVQSGDTLARIAAHNNISLEQMLSINPHITNPDRIFPDLEINLPLPDLDSEGGEPVACDLLELLEEEGIALPLQPLELLDGEQTPDRLVYAERVDEAFLAKVIEIAARLEMNPDHLMAIIYFETGGTFSPSIRNPRSAAVGLIQFLPSTARGLGTTDEALSQMSALEQLDWVERYFRRFTGRLNTLEDAYMAVLFPIAVGEPPEFVLFGRGSRQYERNPGFDADDDGLVTRGEVTDVLARVLSRGAERRASNAQEPPR